MKKLAVLTISVITIIIAHGIANSTPSTQIWIPSTDIQAVGVVHFGHDTYIKTESQNGVTEPTVTNTGLTIGVLPYQNVQMEIGIDYRDTGGEHEYPLYFNTKIGIPENTIFNGSLAIAFGGYDFGTKRDVTTYNIIFGLVSKNIGKLGRFSLGYYTGNEDLLVDLNGKKDNSGILLSWDRTMSEISQRLWLGIDYMGGENVYGALSFGIGWRFASNVSVILGYDIYNESFYKPTATIQVDIDF